MSRRNTAPQIPGEDDTESIRGANQPGDPDDPQAIAEQHERMARANAMAEAAAKGQEPDLAAPAVQPQAPKRAKRAKLPDGTIVDITPRPVDPNVEKYGPESTLAKGTAVRRDGTPCVGSEQAYGVIGDIMTPQGRLISRVIPYESLEEA